MQHPRSYENATFILQHCILFFVFSVTLSTEELSGEFKKKAAAFSRTLRGLEDRAKKCESLKWMVSDHEL